MTQFKENDFIICKPREEKRREPGNINFEIYARIVKISENTVFMDKYMEQGQLHCSCFGKDADGNEVYHKFPLDELSDYYQLMNEDEKRTFRGNLQTLKDRTVKDPWKSIHQYSSKVKATYEAVCEVLDHENDDEEYMGDEGE